MNPAERCCGIVGILTMKRTIRDNASLRSKHTCGFVGKSTPSIQRLAVQCAAPNPLLPE
jgi:hypothetical protein